MESRFDRCRFGNSTLPIWSELNGFESWTISRMRDARAGDPDALLALYLMASGESFSLEDFDRARGEIDLWIDTLPLTGETRASCPACSTQANSTASAPPCSTLSPHASWAWMWKV